MVYIYIYIEVYDSDINTTISFDEPDNNTVKPFVASGFDDHLVPVIVNAGHITKSDIGHRTTNTNIPSRISTHNNNKYIRPIYTLKPPCKVCGLTGRDMHHILRHIHSDNPKEFCFR